MLPKPSANVFYQVPFQYYILNSKNVLTSSDHGAKKKKKKGEAKFQLSLKAEKCFS